DLTVLDTAATFLNPTICAGEIVDVGGMQFDATGYYPVVLTAQNSCDSTVYLDLTVLDTVATFLSPTICAGDVYDVGGMQFDATGYYPVVLTAQNGCDSTVYLDLTVLDTVATFLSPTICAGDVYDVGGMQFDATGYYPVVLIAQNGCDSTVYLDLTVQDTFYQNLDVSICLGSSYFFDGNNYSTSGVYVGAFSTVNGCDSIVVLNLIVDDTIQVNLNVSLCQGDSIEFDGSFYSTTGSYSAQYFTINGCDSTVVLNLTMLDTFQTNLAETICAGAVYMVGGITFDQTGSYIVGLSALNGCDSTVYLDLTVLDTVATVLNETICAGEVFDAGGQAFDATGYYTVVLTAVNGCDSTVYLDLTVLDTLATPLTVAICAEEVYDVGGQLFDTPGYYTVVLTALNGCDSTVYLDLSVLPTYEIPLSASICAGDSLFVGGAFQTVSGMYIDSLVTVNGCDSVMITDLTVHDLPLVAINAPAVICPGDPVAISAGAFTSYSWSPGGETDPTITITQPGTYAVTVTDANGCMAADTAVLTAFCSSVTSLFGVSQDTACVQHLVFFRDSSENATSWFWNLGNGNFSSQQNPFAIYPDTGTFVVSLVASDGIVSDTSYKVIYVYPHVVADFGWTVPDSCLSNVLYFNDNSQSEFPVVDWFWNFGDGNTGSGSGPANEYIGFDIENVSLVITDLYGCKDTINQDVPVENLSSPGDQADAGADQHYCQLPGTVTLSATPSAFPEASGLWSQPTDQAQAGVGIADPLDPNTVITGLEAGNNYVFTWTLGTTRCGDYSSDTVQISAYGELIARNDTFFNLGSPPNVHLDILANDNIPASPEVEVNLLTTPVEGSLTANSDGSFTFTAPTALQYDSKFVYEVCVNDCPGWCESAEVTLLAELPTVPVPPLVPPSNVITPNGDGTADAVIIPNLPDYPNGVEFIVLNRWGDVVYQTKNYDNNWQGTNSNGKQLPDGTYYYILRAGVQNEQILEGTITILR
ncbi:MAG: T9SS type B sorting domain-containing protein, partial [Bacteroidetes bacterium]